MTAALIGLVALLYSLVGHGGASGYLAVMSLCGVPPATMKISALALNLLVAGVAFLNYWRAGHFDRKLFWLFAATSIPVAYVGGRLELSPRVYCAILGSTLVFAAGRLWMAEAEEREPAASPAVPVAAAWGAAIGFVSGVVGVGGGIFLSPLLVLMGWAGAKRSSAVSAAFIWVNSAAGLAGQLSKLRETPVPWSWVGAAAVCSVAGSWLGARKFTAPALRRCLSLVLVTAAFKLLKLAF
ncbi:MAG: sulfite exporter TauE/SafE family protein [Elusimicrobia bacterium]|nr:sulfite exporter TauE/SafE family protein [Elusimicrobiota bacterium]